MPLATLHHNNDSIKPRSSWALEELIFKTPPSICFRGKLNSSVGILWKIKINLSEKTHFTFSLLWQQLLVEIWESLGDVVENTFLRNTIKPVRMGPINVSTPSSRHKYWTNKKYTTKEFPYTVISRGIRLGLQRTIDSSMIYDKAKSQLSIIFATTGLPPIYSNSAHVDLPSRVWVFRSASISSP